MAITDSSRPPYQRIADDIRGQIERGDLRPGDQLPSIRALAESYGVGTMTVQRAIGVLRDNRVVVSTHGHGIFVRDPEAATEPSGNGSIEEHIAVMESDIARLADTLASLKRRLHDTGG